MREESLQAEQARLLGALRRHDAVVGLGWGLVAALALETLLVLAGRLVPLWYRSALLRLLPLLLGSGLLLGALVGAYGSRPLSRRLRRLERNLGLAERLITAWELEQGRITAPPSMVEEQRQETLETLRGLDAGRTFPLRPAPAALRTVLGLVLLLGVALGLPNPQEERLLERQALQEAHEETITEIESLIASVAQDSFLDPETREAALEALEEALSTLEDPQTSPDEQMRALDEAEETLADLENAAAEARVQQLAEAAPLSTEEAVRQMSELLQRRDPQAAAAWLRELVEERGDPLTPEEILALADAFTEMAQALQETDPALADQFQEIAEEIYSGDAQEARAAILEASETLGEVAEGNASNRSLESAQARLQRVEESLGASAGMLSEGEVPRGADASGSGGTAGGEDAGSSAPYGPSESARLEGESGQITLPRERTAGEGEPGVGSAGSARVDYTEAYGEYAAAAEAELSRRSLPPAMRGYIRAYFSSLEEQGSQ
ncbi:MAG: hypothetical protein ACLFU8_16750 [Anaerolineales bacterium]